MKFRVTMKDPDTLSDAIDDALKAELASLADEDEREAVKEIRGQKIRELCSEWFDYGEYLSVDIDTDAKTCTVVPKHS